MSASPEPASNIGLSLLEDGVALALVWFATQYPFLAADSVLVLIVVVAVVVRWLLRRLKALMASPGLKPRGC